MKQLNIKVVNLADQADALVCRIRQATGTERSRLVDALVKVLDDVYKYKACESTNIHQPELSRGDIYCCMLNCISRWDTNSGIKFYPYFTKCLTMRKNDMFRRKGGRHSQVSLAMEGNMLDVPIMTEHQMGGDYVDYIENISDTTSGDTELDTTGFRDSKSRIAWEQCVKHIRRGIGGRPLEPIHTKALAYFLRTGNLTDAATYVNRSPTWMVHLLQDLAKSNVARDFATILAQG